MEETSSGDDERKSEEHMDSFTSFVISQPLLKPVPRRSKTPAERQREYRLRKKKLKAAQNIHKNKPPKKTRADYQREYRLRQKLKKLNDNNLKLNSGSAEEIPRPEAGPPGYVAPVIVAQLAPSSPDAGPIIVQHEAVVVELPTPKRKRELQERIGNVSKVRKLNTVQQCPTEDHNFHGICEHLSQPILAQHLPNDEMRQVSDQHMECEAPEEENLPKQIKTHKKDNAPKIVTNKLESYRRRIIRSTARLIREKKTPDEIWQIMKDEFGCDCETLWNRMRANTIKKLNRLIAVDDRLEYIPPAARLTNTDWLLFDLALVHEDIDVIGQKKTQETGTEYKPMVDLFSLVQKFEIEDHIVSENYEELPKAWALATLHYNKGGRMCSPMLLQKRWFQVKEVTRAKFYGFWKIYRGKNNLKNAKLFVPTKLQTAIAKRFQHLLTKNSISWEEAYERKAIVSPEELTLIMKNSAGLRNSLNGDDNAPDIVLLEPVIETVTLDSDSESESKDEPSTSKDEITTKSEILQINIKKDVTEYPEDFQIDEVGDTRIEGTNKKNHRSDNEEDRKLNFEKFNIAIFDETSTSTTQIDNYLQNSNTITQESDEILRSYDVVDSTPQILNVVSLGKSFSHESVNKIGSLIIPEEEKIDTKMISVVEEAKDVIITMPRMHYGDNEKVHNSVELNTEVPANVDFSRDVSGFSNEDIKFVEDGTDERGNGNAPDIVLLEPMVETVILNYDSESESKDKPSTSKDEITTKSEISQINIKKDVPEYLVDFQIDDDTRFEEKGTKNHCSDNDEDKKLNLEKFNITPQIFDETNVSTPQIDYYLEISSTITQESDLRSYDVVDSTPQILNVASLEEERDEQKAKDLDIEIQIERKLPMTVETKLDDMFVLKGNSIQNIKDSRMINSALAQSKPVGMLKENVSSIQTPIETTFKQKNYQSKVDIDDINENFKLSYSSKLLKKPISLNYNPIQLCKNPDFNTKLKRLTVGFFSSMRNRQQYKVCKPITIDVSKAFESKLIDGTLYLKNNSFREQPRPTYTNIEESSLTLDTVNKMLSILSSDVPDSKDTSKSRKKSKVARVNTSNKTKTITSKKKPQEKDYIGINDLDVSNVLDVPSISDSVTGDNNDSDVPKIFGEYHFLNSEPVLVDETTKCITVPNTITSNISPPVNESRQNVIKRCYINKKRIETNMYYTNSPMFLGNNQILLTSAKFPNKQDQSIFTSQMSVATVPDDLMPPGIQFLLLPDGRLTYTKDPNVELTDQQAASLPFLVSSIQDQIITALPEETPEDRNMSNKSNPNKTTLLIDKAEKIETLNKNVKDPSNISKETNLVKIIPPINEADYINTPNKNPNEGQDQNLSTQSIKSQEQANTELSSTPNENRTTAESFDTKMRKSEVANTPVSINVESSDSQDDTQTADRNTSAEKNCTNDKDDSSGTISNEISTDNADTVKKSILSAMSGILTEDTKCISPKISPVKVVLKTSGVTQNLAHSIHLHSTLSPTKKSYDNSKEISELYPVNSYEELRYACDVKARFFKLDFQSGAIAQIKVCISKKSRNNRGQKRNEGIDLTEYRTYDETYVSTQTKDNMCDQVYNVTKGIMLQNHFKRRKVNFLGPPKNAVDTHLQDVTKDVKPILDSSEDDKENYVSESDDEPLSVVAKRVRKPVVESSIQETEVPTEDMIEEAVPEESTINDSEIPVLHKEVAPVEDGGMEKEEQPVGLIPIEIGMIPRSDDGDEDCILGF